MLQNAYLLAKIGADTAENERKFAEDLPEIGKFVVGEFVVVVTHGLQLALRRQLVVSRAVDGVPA